MSNLASQCNEISGVITADDMSIDDVADYVDKWSRGFGCDCSEWFVIPHFLDVRDDGSLKTPHLHYVAKLKGRVRLKTSLNRIADCLGVSPCQVSIEKCTSYVGCIQYLTHQNEKNKFRYDDDLIATNLERDILRAYLEAEVKKALDFDTLWEIVLKSRSMTEVYREIGLSMAVHYNQILKVMWNDKYNAPLLEPNSKDQEAKSA